MFFRTLEIRTKLGEVRQAYLPSHAGFVLKAAVGGLLEYLGHRPVSIGHFLNEQGAGY